jgi:DNA-binding transcriptional MocR family regulator
MIITIPSLLLVLCSISLSFTFAFAFSFLSVSTMSTRRIVSTVRALTAVGSRRFSAGAAAAAGAGTGTGATSAAAAKASQTFQRLKPGPLKKLYKYYTPEAVNFAGGVPMDSIFPIHSIKIANESEEFEVNRSNGSLMLNYHRGNGIPSLREWIQNHVAKVHNRQGQGFDTCMSVGSTDAFAKVLLLLNGDTVIFDEFAYGAAVGASHALGRTNVGIKMDEEGMLPDELRSQTKLAREKGLNPDIVYLVPESQNPTGRSMSQQRKKEIYEVCKELDLIIVEDDAYYYINFGKEDEDVPGVKSLPKSIFSLDDEGRVLRLDSLSKFVAPGMRLGWIAGPEDFVTKYNLLQEMTSQVS